MKTSRQIGMMRSDVRHNLALQLNAARCEILLFRRPSIPTNHRQASIGYALIHVNEIERRCERKLARAKSERSDNRWQYACDMWRVVGACLSEMLTKTPAQIDFESRQLAGYYDSDNEGFEVISYPKTGPNRHLGTFATIEEAQIVALNCADNCFVRPIPEQESEQ